MSFLFKKLNQKAQHTIEYAVVLILVMAGIIIMGPYVIRSWNAQMKGWEDTVADSFNDPLKTAGHISVPGCDRSPSWVPQGCGLSWSAINCHPPVACSRTQMLSTQSFFPPGCECSATYFPLGPPPNIARCVFDDTCCTDWSPDSTNTGVPDPVPAVDCGNNASPPCPVGNARQNRSCGATITETRCSPDPIC